ncbi:hypothetical protein AFE_0913 [Acidithiobacillus ferrooxidans ATCC 23270]|uniref:Uncharacterized protein n=1 Tax=Acidithiobacillus ferrooxidans (strain ATCC 23270 / DSM 14882 / CIP 104768 / NCIMB 8455) TaxID=243159 RepID=B7J793_ACIF2|nr:hypothetical protein AFE_0913 [Acidithiobacillus ferrooxidans ATCC 23270]
MHKMPNVTKDGQTFPPESSPSGTSTLDIAAFWTRSPLLKLRE